MTNPRGFIPTVSTTYSTFAMPQQQLVLQQQHGKIVDGKDALLEEKDKRIQVQTSLYERLDKDKTSLDKDKTSLFERLHISEQEKAGIQVKFLQSQLDEANEKAANAVAAVSATHSTFAMLQQQQQLVLQQQQLKLLDITLENAKAWTENAKAQTEHAKADNLLIKALVDQLNQKNQQQPPPATNLSALQEIKTSIVALGAKVTQHQNQLVQKLELQGEQDRHKDWQLPVFCEHGEEQDEAREEELNSIICGGFIIE